MASLPDPPLDPHQKASEHHDAAAEALDRLVAQSQTENHPHTLSYGDMYHYLRGLVSYDSLESFENAWHLGNYVIDRETGKKAFEAMSVYVRLGMHFLYYGSEQEAVLHWKRTQEMLRAQSERMGAEYDSPQSKAHIRPFIASFGLAGGLRDLLEPDPEKYATFNDFFAREIKLEARPVAEPGDSLVVSSPADCRLTVFPTIDQATEFWIKGHNFTLANLLKSQTLADQFTGGSIAIARLAPQDYHRWHSPVDGRVESITEIPGTYYTVNPQAVTQPGTLNVFCENRRSVMVIRRSETASPIAVVAVGAMLVGSIVYNPGIEVGADVKRGQCLGAFKYGGSTVIVLTPSGEVELDQDLVANSTQQTCETLVRVGWRIGRGPLAVQKSRLG